MQYLTIIRKAEFVDLFKYGHLYVRRVTAFDGDIQNLKDDVAKFKEVTSDMNLFEYSFEYLMLHISVEQEISCNPEIELSDVRGVYVFNEEAKKEMSISFDSRIQIHVSPWAPMFDKLQEILLQKQSMRGIDNLWKIFGLEETDKTKCAEVIDEQIISETFRELYAYERPQGELSPWVYLLRYERHSLYPRTMSGFFCDFIHVYINWMQQKELHGDVAESTELYNQLNKDKFFDLVRVVKQSLLSQKCKNDIPDCNFYVVAPLYLYLKSLSGDNLEWGDNLKKIVVNSKKYLGFDFALATYLLGITLGYDGTYDCLYNHVGLSIFKAKVLPSDSISEPEDTPVCIGTENEIPGNSETNLQEEVQDIVPEDSGDSTIPSAEEPSVTSEKVETIATSNNDNSPITSDGNADISKDQLPSENEETPCKEDTNGTLIASKINAVKPTADSVNLFGEEETVLMNNGKRKKAKNFEERQIPLSQVEEYKEQGWRKNRNKK